MVNARHKSWKCTKCGGTPSQHRIDAAAEVNGRVYQIHGFASGGGR